jgi:hypothetical protein
MYITLYKVSIDRTFKLFRSYNNAQKYYIKQCDMLREKIGLKSCIKSTTPVGWTHHLEYLDGTIMTFSNTDYAVEDSRGVTLHLDDHPAQCFRDMKELLAILDD